MGKHVKQVTFCYFYKVVPYRFVSQPTARCSCSATTTAANLAWTRPRRTSIGCRIRSSWIEKPSELAIALIWPTEVFVIVSLQSEEGRPRLHHSRILRKTFLLFVAGFPRGIEMIEKVLSCEIGFQDLEKVLNLAIMYTKY